MRLSLRSTTFALSVALLAGGCDTRVRDAHKGLADPDPNMRIKAINAILQLALEGGQHTGWQQLQEKGCRDPDPRVRVAALEALGTFVEARPNEVAPKSLTGINLFVYVNTEFLKSLSADPSANVRIAAAKFWIKADVLSDHGISALREMLDQEKEGEVLAVAREALAVRLERSLKKELIRTDEAEQVRAACNLRTLHP